MVSGEWSEGYHYLPSGSHHSPFTIHDSPFDIVSLRKPLQGAPEKLLYRLLSTVLI